jgi:HPt (histidine-containing phosphotransfer) domain-containing protein
MDDFAPKPIQRQRLAKVLARAAGSNPLTIETALDNRTARKEPPSKPMSTVEALDDERFCRTIFEQLSRALGRENARNHLRAVVMEASGHDRLPAPSTEPSGATDLGRSPSEPSFDYATALARAANLPELLKKIARVAVSQIPEWRGRIQSATRSNSTEAVSQAAHTIRGAVSNLAAHSCVDLAAALEIAARNNDWPQIKALTPKIDAELERLSSSLRRTVLEAS